MTRTNQHELSPRTRANWTVVALGLVCMLAIAAWLTPSERGYGTHQQLGLPPCSFSMLFGLRCPSCGMTTSWSHVVRGDIVRALQANVGGTLLALLAVLATPWSIGMAVRGRRLGDVPVDRMIVCLAVLVVCVTLVDWICRLIAGL